MTTQQSLTAGKVYGAVRDMKLLLVAAVAFGALALYLTRWVNAELFRRALDGFWALMTLGFIGLVCLVALVLAYVLLAGVVSAFAESRGKGS